MNPYHSIFGYFLFTTVTTITARETQRATSEWPNKETCDVIARKITAEMTRKDVELLLKPYKPYPWAGGGQGGPQSSSYVLAPSWTLVVWYDLHRSSGIGNPTVLSPLDRVNIKAGVTVVPLKPPFGPTDDEFRQFQQLLK